MKKHINWSNLCLSQKRPENLAHAKQLHRHPYLNPISFTLKMFT